MSEPNNGGPLLSVDNWLRDICKDHENLARTMQLYTISGSLLIIGASRQLTRRSTVVNVPDFLDSKIALAFSKSSNCVFCASASVA